MTRVRAAALAAIAGALPRRRPATLVAVDGVDGAGKTTFADELASMVDARPVIRASADDFLQPRVLRYARGRESPEGYLADTYDYPRLRSYLLDPVRAGAPYRVKAFDHRRDAPVAVPEEPVPDGAVLILDGMFLHRPELAGYWDLSVFLRVDFAVTYARMAVRDSAPPDPADPANWRYVEGQRLYLARYSPESLASVVVDHNDLAAPILTWPASPPG